jgi:hypothetical protein
MALLTFIRCFAFVRACKSNIAADIMLLHLASAAFFLLLLVPPIGAELTQGARQPHPFEDEMVALISRLTCAAAVWMDGNTRLPRAIHRV